MGNQDGKVTIGTGFDLSGLEKGLGDISGELGGLKTILQSIDKNISAAFSTEVIQKCEKEVEGLKNELNRVNSKLDDPDIGKPLDNVGKSAKSATKQVNNASNAVNGFRTTLKRLAGVIATVFSLTAILSFGRESIQLGSDLQEVQNVVDVTFSTMNEQVNDFAKNAMHTAGLSETMAKQYTGTFGAMANSFKFTEKQAFAMSTTLTQLTGDVASFYNISQDEAYTKLSAVFTGETEALKHLGVVMTENALNEFAMQKGMDKTVQKMTEQEKVALRYKFVLEQLSGASGDFTRTSGSWANQTRLLTVQFNQLKATIGQGLINALTPVLRVINNLIARLQVLANAFVKLTVELFGDASGGAAGASSTVADNYESAAESAGGIADETERAGKAAQKYLAGFDEIKKLGDSSGSGSGGAGGGGAGAAGGNIDIPEIDLSKIEAGFEIDDETIQKVADIIRTIAEYIPVIASGFAGLKLGSFLADLVTANVEVKTLKESVALLGKKASLISGITLAITGITLETNGIISAIQEGLNGINFTEILGGGGTLIAGAALIGKTFGGALLGGGVGAIIAGIPMYITGIYDAIVNGIEWLSAALISVGATLTGAGIGAIIGACGGPIGAGIGALAGLVIGLLTDFFIWFWQKFDEVEAWFTSVPTSLTGWVAKIAAIVALIPVAFLNPIATVGALIITFIKKFDDIRTALADTWVKIQEIWAPVATWFNENVIIPIQDFFSPIVEWFTELFGEIEQTVSDVLYNIGVLAEGCWAVVEAIWEQAPGWIDENIIQPISTFFSDLWTDISTKAEDAWVEIKQTYQFAKDWLHQNVVLWLENKFEELWDLVPDWAKDACDKMIHQLEKLPSKITSVINSIIGHINRGIRQIFSGVNDMIRELRSLEIAGITPFSGLRTINVPQIPYLAKGAVLPPNKPFLAMVGDQRHGTNVEAPLATIQEAVALVMQDMVASNIAGHEATVAVLREILEAVLGIHIGDDVIASAVDRHRNKMAIVRGGAL